MSGDLQTYMASIERSVEAIRPSVDDHVNLVPIVQGWQHLPAYRLVCDICRGPFATFDVTVSLTSVQIVADAHMRQEHS